MTKKVNTHFFASTNDHKAQLLNDTNEFNFSIEITKCIRTEDIPCLRVFLLQRGNLEPIFESKYVDLLVQGANTQLTTKKFGPPYNPNPNHYTVPYLIIIKSDVPDVELEDFEFQVNCYNILA